ncbi:MAG: hypothetical protein QNJ34_01300 [Xenococcaceae cyanobacterium MO_188.B29]|nr:hypothetical protein [Xenococcaceae cyanobacterium MO_188.B29]
MKLGNLGKFIFQLLRSLTSIDKKHLLPIPLLVFLNGLAIVALGSLSIYAKIENKGAGIENLFSDPFNRSTFYLGWFTGISEILWSTAIAVCLFTTFLLPPANRKVKGFFLVSSLLMALLYFDDRFRLTLILVVFFGAYTKVKAIVYSIYGSLLILYGWKFRQIIKKTLYLPLILSFLLFTLSSVVDITPMTSRGAHAMLEDGTKLIGLINLTLYFWYACYTEVKQYILDEKKL